VKIPWSNLWVGAGVTALLFNIGKFLIGLYLGSSSVSSGYGAAGSLIVILIWVFYSAQILLFGAEFTQVYSKYRGKPIRPSKHAVPISQTSDR
jgi:membrane protein